MSRESNPVYLTSDEDDDIITSEQSSMSTNLMTDEGAGEDSPKSFKSNSSTEISERGELTIEEPPSFLESGRYGPQPSVSRKKFPDLQSEIEDEESKVYEIFERKKDKTGTSSSKTKPRVRNKRNSRRGTSSGNFKSGKAPAAGSARGGTKKQKMTANENDRNFGGDGEQTDLQVGSTSDEVSFDSESSASTFRRGSGASRRKHITVTLENDQKKEVLEEIQDEVLQISGVTVKFPVKPYPSQIAVMSKMIQGCKKEQNCLLESPTGSGKTLALLCGVLAWQEYFKDEIQKQNEENLARRDTIEARGMHVEMKRESDSRASATPTKVDQAAGDTSALRSCGAARDDAIEHSDDADFQPCKRFCQSTSPAVSAAVEKQKLEADSIFEGDEELFDLKSLIKSKQRVPTIYYGSRTHKQIEQVIRELKKTAYAHKPMTILSSREFTCIQSTQENKTELCARLLDPIKGSGCKFYNDRNRQAISSNYILSSLGIDGPWDIEDLVEIGKEQMACPYFAAKNLMSEADIVFCPYNYLVDPNIRESMQIQLTGQVVILDEAHNIEELSREVGSITFREDKISEAVAECKMLRAARKHDQVTYDTIQTYLSSLEEFLKVNILNSVDTFSETASSAFWTGRQLSELFDIHGLGKGAAKSFEAAAGAAIMDFNNAKESNAKQLPDHIMKPTITQITKRLLEDLGFALRMMTSETLANDYRACIIESDVKDWGPLANNTWHSRDSTKRMRTLQMMCMNPAVIFAPLANITRSIILASGTLSPISSFQSELGTIFTHKLDANHVVPKENVYIRGIPCGPTGVQLKANYTNVNAWNFQDELGNLILQVIRVIPHGILCFFSSYTMMQKQITRWKHTSCWEKFQEFKCVLQEPRGASNLAPIMKQYREVIEATSDCPHNGITGAVLFAVFRGKVAEGIDFSDNEARCVMAIGIPYAVRKDPSVDMKFTYNDLNQSKGLLKGGEWYAVQAFRALNQALGRCLRHRNDWGAVLLIDQRFLDRSNYNYLPKWVKTMWRDSARYDLSQELQQFVAKQLERTKPKTLDADNSDP